MNHYSASASEIVSACLQDHKRAVVMGERTWGKGSVQNIIELENGRTALKLTTAAYKRPSGKNIHRFPNSQDKDEWGVMPDLGYELGLGDRETHELLVDRRNRDVIAAHAVEEKSAAAPAAAGPQGGKLAVAPIVSPASLGPAVKGEPLARQSVPAKGREQGAGSKEQGGKGDEGKRAAKADSAPKAEKKPFVDRQLEMAVKYLRDELAKKKG